MYSDLRLIILLGVVRLLEENCADSFYEVCMHHAQLHKAQENTAVLTTSPLPTVILALLCVLDGCETYPSFKDTEVVPLKAETYI